MSIKASIYDFFGYALPGGLIILIVLHGCEVYGFSAYFTRLTTYEFSTWLVFGIMAYLMGFIVEPLIKSSGRFFLPKKSAESIALEDLKKRSPHLNIEILSNDWAIWFASIRSENLELAYEIDRFNAQSKMMKGVGFAYMLLFLLLSSYIVSGKYSLYYITALPLLAGISILSIKQAFKFKRWFYMVIFETIIARNEPFNLKR